MDWATLFTDYGTLISSAIGLVGIALTYFFTKRHYERNRKWELEDRDYDRRIQIRDRRILDAQEYLESYKKMIFHLISYEREIVARLDAYIEGMYQLEEGVYQFNELEDSETIYLSKKRSSIDLLNDPELKKLDAKLSSDYWKEEQYARELTRNIKHNMTIDKIELLGRLVEFSIDMPALVNIMQMRLEKLAETNE